MMVVTDTLATTTDGTALMFQSKAWALPHLNMAIAATGVANLGSAWNEFLLSSAVVQDMRMIDRFAPEELRLLWQQVLDNGPKDTNITATIYHFGFENGSDRAVRYVYRSASDFRSERIEDSGFGVKPAPRNFTIVEPESSDEIVELALRIRGEQDELPPAKRITIGGELQMMFIQNRLTQTMRIHRFSDYENAWQKMVDRLAQASEEGPLGLV
ncbi:hypothetical protein [Cryobacterium sp. MLB-32]|uniref:hypothetical protein n=1 Tax=Cryobacterium sp. MLB-32 TaxID=1529318 RepID=UPI0012E070B0|nr:hypothetical protein [Cryobacterium sp. MLB-32]